jgi:lipid-binding SYLF domain-containing protein
VSNKERRFLLTESGLRGIAIFGRVLSAGFLIGGYAFLGVRFARWLEARGYSLLTVALTPIVVTLFGLWQGWLFISRFGKNEKAKK